MSTPKPAIKIANKASGKVQSGKRMFLIKGLWLSDDYGFNQGRQLKCSNALDTFWSFSGAGGVTLDSCFHKLHTSSGFDPFGFKYIVHLCASGQLPVYAY